MKTKISITFYPNKMVETLQLINKIASRKAKWDVILGEITILIRDIRTQIGHNLKNPGFQ